MKICIISDLHLPYRRDAVQYRALEYFYSEAVKKKADIIICAGDFTADGDPEAARFFVKRTEETGIPFGIIAGNSDLRAAEKREEILALQSPMRENGIFMLEDAERTLGNEEMTALENSAEVSAVFMHHPAHCLLSPSRERFEKWRNAHPEAYVFSAHLHFSEKNGRDISLPAADPDKAIGASPSVMYFNTESGRITEDRFYCPIPEVFFKNIGFSCYTPIDDIPYAAAHGIGYLELHGIGSGISRERLKEEIAKWKRKCGKGLSVHAPDIKAGPDGSITNGAEWNEFTDFVSSVGAGRITLHVPRCSVSEYPLFRDNIIRFAAEKVKNLPEGTVIGIENMHMTAKDAPDESRRFGYIPAEVIEFMNDIKNAVKNPVGINLDIGHARNNAPFSEKYTLGAWYAEVGKYAVGYHVHQVTVNNGSFENHNPPTEPYGRLISLASFFSELQHGNLSAAPMIFEVRGGRYPESIEWIENERRKKVCDLHSHTNISFCGKDEPEVLIEKAISQGIDILGICDHSYGIGKEKKKYFDLQTSLAEKYSDRIKIIRGIEIPTVSSRFNAEDISDAELFDYALIEHIDFEDSAVKDDLWGFLDSFGTRLGIAHTDLFGYCWKRGIDPEEFFAALARRNIFWEMNVSFDSTHGYREHGYVEEFFNSEEQQKTVLNSGTVLSVGFDSHKAEDYCGDRIANACGFLIGRGFRLAFLNE